MNKKILKALDLARSHECNWVRTNIEEYELTCGCCSGREYEAVYTITFEGTYEEVELCGNDMEKLVLMFLKAEKEKP